MIKKLSCILLSLALIGCSDWMGDKEEPPLPGKRISLQAAQEKLKADTDIESEQVVLPQMPANAAWPQALGNATGVSGNLAFSAQPKVIDSVAVGDGAAFIAPVIPAPVMADGMVFAMDGNGVISAHRADDLGKVYWQSEAITHNEDDDEGSLLGGGLAWANGAVFAVNDEGTVAALTSNDGTKRWVREFKLPIRSAPRIAGKFLLILTADNQLMALRQSTGELVWSHRGINEISGKLRASPPAARDGAVLASYSSGEVFALELDNGNPLWNDNLAGSGLNSADPATFSTVSPIMATGLSFAGSTHSLTAFESESGNRLWDRKISSLSAPWLAGNYLFVLTADKQLAAIRGINGTVPWIRELPSTEKGALWFGPIVAGGKIWLTNNQGELLAFDPQTGKTMQTIEVPDGVLTAPIIAGQGMYLLTQDAKLVWLK